MSNQPVGGALNGANLQLAAESSYGSIDAADATSHDISGLTFRSVMCKRASWGGAFSALKMATYQPDTIGARAGMAAPEVESAYSSGVQTRRIAGTVSLSMPMRFLSTTLPANSSLGLLLSSCMTYRSRAAGTSETATYVSANTYSVADAAINHLAGDIVCIDSDTGLRRYCRVTNVDVGTDIITLLTPHGQNAGTFTIRHCHLWYPDVDGILTGSSIAMLAFDRGAKAQVLAAGGRVSKIGFSLAGGDSKTLEVAFDIMFPDGHYLEGSSTGTLATVLPWGVAGTLGGKWLNSPMTVSADGSSSSAPFSLAAESPPARSWSASIDIGLAPGGGFGETRTGQGDYQCVSHDLAVSLTMDAPASGWSPRDTLRLQEQRSLMIAYNGDAAAGVGMALHIGRVVVPEDPGQNMEDALRTSQPSLRAGQYAGDTATGAVANTPWSLALVS